MYSVAGGDHLHRRKNPGLRKHTPIPEASRQAALKKVIRLQSQNDCRDFPESLPSQLHRSDHACRELRRNRRYYQRNGWIRPPIHHTGHHPVPIVQAPKRAVPSTQTEFFPDFTSHLILRYIRPQVIVPMLCCPANQRTASHADSRSQKRNAQRSP